MMRQKDSMLQQRVCCQSRLQNKSTTPLFSSLNCSATDSSTSIHADPSQVSKLSDLDVTPSPPPKVKQIRKTSIQAQRHRANQLELKKHHSNAHKQATTWFADEVEKKKNGATNTKSAAFVCSGLR